MIINIRQFSKLILDNVFLIYTFNLYVSYQSVYIGSETGLTPKVKWMSKLSERFNILQGARPDPEIAPLGAAILARGQVSYLAPCGFRAKHWYGVQVAKAPKAKRGDNLCKHFEPRSGTTESGSKLFDTLIMFLGDVL